jgi:hypothetical protein
MEKLEIAMAKTLGAGGDGAEDIGSNQRDLTDRQCAIVRSTGCTPSRRLTPAGVAGIEDATTAAIQSREPEREMEKGARRLAGSGSDRAIWLGSTRWASGPTGGSVGRQVGQERVLTRN